jgi:hypothetical protein
MDFFELIEGDGERLFLTLLLLETELGLLIMLLLVEADKLT